MWQGPLLEPDGAGKQEAQLSTLLLGSPASPFIRAVAAELSCGLAPVLSNSCWAYRLPESRSFRNIAWYMDMA